MPGRRKKRSNRSRKPPLIFSESPVDLSRRFTSPVSCAINPRTADIVSLNDLHHTTWVSPQFDLTRPPSVPRRRGRRRGQQTGKIRTACSQGNHAVRDMVADIGIDDIRGCDPTDDRSISDGDISGNLRDGFERNVGNREENCHCPIPDISETDKENTSPRKNGRDENHGRTIQNDNCLGIDMSLCSLVETNLPCERQTSATNNRNSRVGDMPESEPSNPLGNVNCDVNRKSRVCHSCTGKCLALAEDTPVHEYNLRVSVRHRKGRLPKVAWDHLILESLGTG